MSTELVLLAVLMFAATYPSRALGLLTPGLDRLPRVGFQYLQLVGPAVLAALAAVNTVTITDDEGRTFFYIGIEWLAVLACLVVTAWRRNLLVGLLVAVGIVALARTAGLSGIPI